MRILHNKKGIELSINFIVMLILGTAVFIGGLVFASKFFSHAENVRGNLDSQTEKQIEKLLDSGSPVVIPISQKEIFRNKFGTFGVGVLARETGDYTIRVTFKKAFNPETKQDIIVDGVRVNAQSWLDDSTSTQTRNLKKNEKSKFLVGVAVPKGAKKGTYLFDVSSEYRSLDGTEIDPEYDDPIQFIVRVP
ncbi:hypothetical protein ACFL3V_06645 [Nanoarchaeota archaeon]